MTPVATPGDALRAAARAAPGEPALVGDRGTLTWAELADRAQRAATSLRALSARARPEGEPPRPHAVGLRPDRDDVIVLLAHALAGIPVLPLHPAPHLAHNLLERGGRGGHLQSCANGCSPRICLPSNRRDLAVLPEETSGRYWASSRRRRCLITWAGQRTPLVEFAGLLQQRVSLSAPFDAFQAS